jgi:hypothetical protein
MKPLLDTALVLVWLAAYLGLAYRLVLEGGSNP